jgi:Sulfotransferase domain
MTESKVDFFFAGFPKSGTTTFYYLLKLHPEIVVPNIKEINYFNSDHNRESEKHLGVDYFQLAKSEEEYLKFFPGDTDKIKGDFNPIYIFSEEAPRNIFEHNHTSKILISIREPVSFLRSFHFQSLYNMIEDEPDFLRALSLEESRRAGQNIPRYCHNSFYLQYSFLVEYKKHIKHFTDIFGYDNVKIILFDDIIKNEDTVYQTILRFLDVKDMNFVPSKADRNPSHSLRFAWLRGIIFSPPIKRWLYTNTPQKLMPLGAKISQMVFKKRQQKPSVSTADIDGVKARFRSNVVELDSFLNETGLLHRSLLTLWDY